MASRDQSIEPWSLVGAGRNSAIKRKVASQLALDLECSPNYYGRSSKRRCSHDQTNHFDGSAGDGRDGPARQTSHSEFTGEILTVLYVKDLQQSVAFYSDVLGFRFDHYYDHHTGDSVVEWLYDDLPVYAEMWAGPSRFALHLATKDYEKRVGGSIHYFSVSDVDAHSKAVAERGGTRSEMIDRPWMRMFSVEDPDGHQLFFQTRPEEE